MSIDIDTLTLNSGRLIREDNSVINIANSIDHTGGIYTTDELTHAVHKGVAYSYAADGSVAALSSLYFLGTTGAKQVHFQLFSGDFQKGGIRISLYEAPTTTADGTAQIPVNMNFVSTNVATLLLFSAPTVTANGTLKAARFLPLTGVGVNTASANGDIAGGRVLKANTKYLFRLENTDATACTFGINFAWIEEDVIL
jgi:hypothetical protein